MSCSGSQSVRKNIALHLKPQTGSGKARSKEAVSKQKRAELVADSRPSDVTGLCYSIAVYVVWIVLFHILR